MPEPAIRINGTKLTESQAMTVRCALGAYAMDLQHNGLGDDEHGKQMSAAYLARLGEIFALINATPEDS